MEKFKWRGSKGRIGTYNYKPDTRVINISNFNHEIIFE